MIPAGRGTTDNEEAGAPSDKGQKAADNLTSLYLKSTEAELVSVQQ